MIERKKAMNAFDMSNGIVYMNNSSRCGKKLPKVKSPKLWKISLEHLTHNCFSVYHNEAAFLLKDATKKEVFNVTYAI